VARTTFRYAKSFLKSTGSQNGCLAVAPGIRQDVTDMLFDLTRRYPCTLLLLVAGGCSSSEPTHPEASTGAESSATGATTTTSGTTGGPLTATAGVTSTTLTATTSVSSATTATSNASSNSSTSASTSVGGATSSTVSTAVGGAGGVTGTTGGTTGPSAESIIIQANFDDGVNGMPPDSAFWEAYPQGQESLAPVLDGSKANSVPSAVRVTMPGFDPASAVDSLLRAPARAQ